MGLLRANTSGKVGTLSARDGNRLHAGARDGLIPIAYFMLKVDCELEPCTVEIGKRGSSLFALDSRPIS